MSTVVEESPGKESNRKLFSFFSSGLQMKSNSLTPSRGTLLTWAWLTEWFIEFSYNSSFPCTKNIPPKSETVPLLSVGRLDVTFTSRNPASSRA